VLVSDEDADLAGLTWFTDRDGYLIRTVTHEDGHVGTVRMHRIILGRMMGRKLGRFELTDHINGVPSDNRRSNLRVATPSQNALHRTKMNRTNSSGFSGVTPAFGRGRWRARIKVYGKKISFGSYATKEEAHEAYVKGATALCGEFLGITK
jgi:hypothetical protein